MRMHLLFAAVLLFLLIPHSADCQVQKFGLAVMNIKAIGIPETAAASLTETFHSGIYDLVTQKKPSALRETYDLIERSQMDKVFDQFKVQDSGCTDVDCAVEFGKMLSVNRIIISSIGLVGETYTVAMRLVEVETSKILRSVSRKHEGKIDGVIDLLPLMGYELLTGMQPIYPVARIVPAPPAAASPGSKDNSAASPSAESRRTESYLTVEGKPAEADVIVNDQNIGKTPVSYYSIAPGRYTVKVVHSGYIDQERELIIAPGKQERISYTLEALAKLAIRGEPAGAAISVDGKHIGDAPISGWEVPKGAYTVKAAREGYTEFERGVSLSPGETKEIAYSLVKYEALSIESLPEGASVSIDGKPAGATPLRDYRVTEGGHEIAIRLMGYETHRETLSSKPSETRPSAIVLIPKTKQKVFMKSVLLPGSGQLYAEYKAKGTLITVLQLATLAGAVGASLLAKSANDDYSEAHAAYKNIPQSDIRSIPDARAKMKDTYNKASSASNIQLAVIGAAAAVYAWNLIDAAFTEPKIEVHIPKLSTGGNGVALAVRF